MRLRGAWGFLGQALLVVLFAAPSRAFWVPDGGFLNAQGNTENAAQPSLAVGTDGTVWAAWIEETTSGTPQLFVKFYSGGSWYNCPPTLTCVNTDPGFSARTPSLELDVSVTPNRPYLAYQEKNGVTEDIVVKTLNGSSWVQMGTRLNTQNAVNPHLRVNVYNTLYAVWEETRGGVQQIFAKRWNSGSWDWVLDAFPLNRDVAQNAAGPRLACGVDGSPYVTWMENVPPGFTNVFVDHFSGSGWTHLGGSQNLNATLQADQPDLLVRFEGLSTGTLHDVLYLVWAEVPSLGPPRALPAKRWNGTSWELLSTDLQADPVLGMTQRPRLALANLYGVDTPYLAWAETIGTTTSSYMRHWTGSDWTQDNGTLALPWHNVSDPDLAARNTALYAAFTDPLWVDAVANSRTLVFVQHWAVPTLTPTPTPAVTPPPETDEAYIYPVPASSQATFAFNAPGNSGAVEVLVYNTHFRLVKRLTGATATGRGTLVWDTSEVPPGLYFYQVRVGGKRFGTQKMVIAR